MKSLSTKNIINEINTDVYAKRNFIGVFPRDRLPNVVSYPSSLIINTHPQGQPGEHCISQKQNVVNFSILLVFRQQFMDWINILSYFQDLLSVMNFKYKTLTLMRVVIIVSIFCYSNQDDLN